MPIEFTTADAVCLALHENGAYHDADPKTKWLTIEEITGAVSPNGDTKYLRGIVTKAVESLVKEGSLVWLIFGGKYALSSDLSASFIAKCKALEEEGA